MAGSNDVAQVFAAKPKATGGVRTAPRGTAMPTDANTDLDALFDNAGYVGEDGLVESGERSTDKIRAWGGDTVKVVQTEYSLTYQFTFIQKLNPVVLKAVHGEQNVEVTAATPTSGTLSAVKLNADTLPHLSWVFDMKDGNALIRVCVSDGQVTEVGETTYADGEVAGYEVTVEAFLDRETGANAIKYCDDAKFAAA